VSGRKSKQQRKEAPSLEVVKTSKPKPTRSEQLPPAPNNFEIFYAACPDFALHESPVAEAFAAGALDFEAGVRSRAPNRRDPPQPRANGFDLGEELFRASLLGEIARATWGVGILDPAQVQAAHAPEELSLRDLQTRAKRLSARRPGGDDYLAIANDLAAMTLFKLAEATAHGVDPSLGEEALDGQEALLEAARLSGRAATATALAGEDLHALWDSIDAACARLARLS
jgi:hypothetical protein